MDHLATAIAIGMAVWALLEIWEYGSISPRKKLLAWRERTKQELLRPSPAASACRTLADLLLCRLCSSVHLSLGFHLGLAAVEKENWFRIVISTLASIAVVRILDWLVPAADPSADEDGITSAPADHEGTPLSTENSSVIE